MSKPYQICKRCIMDTSDPDIQFDANGICNHCTTAIERIGKQLLPQSERSKALTALIEKIKTEGRGKDYDCIIGVSGGVDSTTTAYYVKKLGLRPLAVHFDNGWDSELAVDNINKTLNTLGIELYTYVVDWEEFRDLQMCFLKASVTNCEIPTDHGITALLFKMACKEKIRFILSGSNVVTEAIMPYSWGHYNQDLKHMVALHKRYGSIPLKTMPTINIFQYFSYVFIKKIRQIPFLNYIEYNKNEAKKMLMKEIGWRDYGGKHYESVWTRFFQGYYLPAKFGYDKRRAHLSTLICSGQMSRDTALAEMEKSPYDPDLLKQDMQFVLKKFRLTKEEFDEILHALPKKATDYPSHYFLFHVLQRYKNVFRKIATSA
ncbi:MAG: N-acetyl sugar amidotransferase [Candidatus Jettenia sp. CY-1]|nr:N-acetyl sugar amidotransferase [Candidatus Jettenia sp.]WKZ19223.1 MAG: N-acetyl sugar amidotransferase [Candidatus Jettenia sp. CY-1]